MNKLLDVKQVIDSIGKPEHQDIWGRHSNSLAIAFILANDEDMFRLTEEMHRLTKWTTGIAIISVLCTIASVALAVYSVVIAPYLG